MRNCNTVRHETHTNEEFRFGSSGAIRHFDYPGIMITATLFPHKRLALLTNSISFKPCIFNHRIIFK